MPHKEHHQTAADLIYLISCAVNGIQPAQERVAAMDDEAVFRFACRQDLSAIAAYALKKLMPLPLHWKEARGKAMRLCALYDTRRAMVLHEMEQQGIPYLPLKGIILKDYYPEPFTREMADNDILCDDTRMEDVRTIMTKLGFTCKLFGKYNHDKYTSPPLSFEMHTQLFVDYDVPQIAAYYQGIWEKLIRDEEHRYGYHMRDEDFYLYILCHTYKHFIKAGTGLRSLLDIYLYDRAKGQTLDRRYLDEQLAILGIGDFERDFRALAAKTFSGESLSDDVLDELSYYIESGSFGSGRNKYANRLRHDDGRRAKRRYFFRRFFPDEAYLKSFYPTVYRHRSLYPLLVIYRPFKGLVTKRKKLYREFQFVKNYKKKD
ncbi:nucleotidyltransferase family protein [Ruminococcus sp.]|uniref:nucleotidyltransferase domain-containing protein n=1 Tax=Ruminococcus sp. TaxID=41978 RepID=UPI0038908A14